MRDVQKHENKKKKKLNCLKKAPLTTRTLWLWLFLPNNISSRGFDLKHLNTFTWITTTHYISLAKKGYCFPKFLSF